MYRIAVVDDHPEWLSFSCQILTEHGYNVVPIRDIVDLNRLLDKNKIDLILLNADFMKDPFAQPIRELFQRSAHKPIIVVSVPRSVHETVQETRTAFKLGAADCVDKPFSRERLLLLVQDLLTEFINTWPSRQGVCS